MKNCNNAENIMARSAADPVIYDRKYVNLVIVSRLSKEKGIDRAVLTAAELMKHNIPFKLHIIGNGSEYYSIQDLIKKNKLTDTVILYGDQSNPYRFMKNADILLITSYHEAAGLVIDEARILCLPVLSVKTISAEEMIGEHGWICENSIEAFREKLLFSLKNKHLLEGKKRELSYLKYKCAAAEQFDNLTEREITE
jgi:glycosyltransferase involved in cell wall biosynthesis